MRTTQPTFIASEELVWLKADGGEVKVVARVGIPYKDDEDLYRCPVELDGVDSRYLDIAGQGSMQALCLALSLLATRLTHLLEDGERFVYAADRSPWDASALAATFGRS